MLPMAAPLPPQFVLQRVRRELEAGQAAKRLAPEYIRRNGHITLCAYQIIQQLCHFALSAAADLYHGRIYDLSCILLQNAFH